MNKRILANEMNRLVLLASCLLLSVINPASASEARNCGAIDSNLSTAERNAQIQECLARASSPANVKELTMRYKKQTCIQNAKNKGLKGTVREIYLESCVNKNEAQETFSTHTGQ